ncbi:MAG TPA: prolipoprotein diacylglyceryl transferase [Lachnospiraceae bacterium]|jgi:phosphatidylglycerol:prolipoprotein diacylglycerol transferase|nr:prolipoprotein diacylglyceryl transferase [Lachnospiraceae bacterium]HBY70909.1 prolipoprotein diacylglyceryl transferase [Lachnospiraceae bacterium]HCA70060.1 prolipoprotein diacylglyceryl transferase [Lachnospiraceae bacterium]HCM13312.1 prolipoprotein diacylglyceryl transferase [Lachnospiraceae bacterium]
METLLTTNIRFPNLGIELKNVASGIDIFGFRIAFYGIIIGIGMLLGWLIAEWMAKRTGQDQEFYLDFTLIAIIVSVISARIYYVIFAFDEFRDDPLSIFNLRTGGLAIYGGIIGAVLTAIIYSKIKKYSFWLLVDTGCIGLVTGQLIGRWGNFFNREAFGKFTNGLFAMQLDLRDVAYDYRAPLNYLQTKYEGRPDALQRILEIRDNTVFVEGVEYIQVHPTFLYESIWNFCLLIFLILFTKHKKFDGEVMLLYLIGYGLGRVWIEGLRTDQLFLWGTPIAVSQLLSALIVVVSLGILFYKRRKTRKINVY